MAAAAPPLPPRDSPTIDPLLLKEAGKPEAADAAPFITPIADDITENGDDEVVVVAVVAAVVVVIDVSLDVVALEVVAPEMVALEAIVVVEVTAEESGVVEIGVDTAVDFVVVVAVVVVVDIIVVIVVVVAVVVVVGLLLTISFSNNFAVSVEICAPTLNAALICLCF